MKKLIALAFFAASISLSANAQTQRNDATTQNGARAGQKHGDKKHDLEGLNLSNEQKTKMQAIKADGKAKMEALKAKNLSEEEKKTQMKAIRMDQKKQMESIMTADQKATIKKNRAEAKTKGEGMKGKKGGKSHGNIDPAVKAKYNAIKNDPNLTNEQKKAEMQKLKDQYKSQRSAIRSSK